MISLLFYHYSLCWLFQRYYYYIERGIKKEMLAQQPREVVARMKDLIPSSLIHNPKLGPLTVTLEEEVDMDYEFSLRKAIGEGGDTIVLYIFQLLIVKLS